MDESFLGSKFDGRLEVRWANRNSDRSSMDESCHGSKFDARLEVRWGYQHSDNSAPNIVQNGVPYGVSNWNTSKIALTFSIDI